VHAVNLPVKTETTTVTYRLESREKKEPMQAALEAPAMKMKHLTKESWQADSSSATGPVQQKKLAERKTTIPARLFLFQVQASHSFQI
jgi:hypothetical protein